jgi:hypothetical protein
VSARSKRLAGPVSVVGDGATVALYTAPVGKTALVKSIRVVAPGSDPASLELGVGGTTAAQLVLKVAVAAGDTYVDPDNDPIVLQAGETLYAQGQAVTSPFTNTMTVTLSGAELNA